MRILHINKFLYRRGGAEAYMLDLATLQREQGHDVAFFSTHHPDNEPSAYATDFPEYVELNPPPRRWSDKARAAARILHSKTAADGLARVVARFRPHIAHVHNIYHHLSPSVLRPLSSRHIPMVMTLHDFKLACPTHRFMANGRVCEACVPRRFYMASVKRCLGGSFAASSLNGIELAAHTLFRSYEPINRFICPSRFLAEKMTESRVFPDRLRVVPNFVDASRMGAKQTVGGGIVYAGRLAEEKGVDILIRAASDLSCDVHVVGNGPNRRALEALAERVGSTNVTFHGHLPVRNVHDWTRASAVAVMPSRGYENAPMGILEAFACGVPVVAADHGGLPELVHADVDGELVPPGDASALAAALDRLVTDPERSFEMGQMARSKVLERFSPAIHLERIDEVYAEATAAASRP